MPSTGSYANLLHVACSPDARFAPDCAVMLASLVASNHAQRVHVHLLHDRWLRAQDLDFLRAIVVGAGGSFNALEIDHARVDGVTNQPSVERYSLNAWYRVLLPELLPDLPRVLYIDSDALITAPLDVLWEMDLAGCLLAAVTNPLLANMVPRIQAQLGLPDGARYFNSGVLLIDLEAWRAAGISDAVLSFARRNPALPWVDQDALNAVLHARRLHLHPRWNAMPGIWSVPRRYLPHTSREVHEAALDPAIVHFVGEHKPWHYRCRHPYRAEYFAYLEQTPWRGRPIEGRSLWQAMLRPLPWLWAYHIEVALARLRQKVGHIRGRVRFGGGAK